MRMNSAYRLLVEQGPDKGREFAIPDGGADIGRSDQNTMVLADAELSRRHCRLDFRDGALWVADLASANGTFVNGREVQESPLAPGDRLSIGASVLAVAGPEGAPPQPAPATPVDLGFGGASGERAVPGAPKRTLAWAVAAALVVAAAALAAKLILETPVAEEPKPLRPREEPQALALRFHKLQADLDNVFRYEVRLDPDGSLAVEIDDLRQSRHVRREADKPVAPELLADLARAIGQSGVLGLDEKPYEGIAAAGTATEYDLLVAIGRSARRIRVANRAEPEEFREARERIETFVRNELGLWAVEYSAEQLREMARENLLVGQRMLDQRDLEPGNLHEACRRFRECANLLETVEPKPDFHADAVRPEAAYLRLVSRFAAIVAFQRVVYRLFVERAYGRSFAVEGLFHRLFKALCVDIAKRRLVSENGEYLPLDELGNAEAVVRTDNTGRTRFKLRYRVFDGVAAVAHFKHGQVVGVVAEADELVRAGELFELKHRVRLARRRGEYLIPQLKRRVCIGIARCAKAVLLGEDLVESGLVLRVDERGVEHFAVEQFPVPGDRTAALVALTAGKVGFEVFRPFYITNALQPVYQRENHRCFAEVVYGAFQQLRLLFAEHIADGEALCHGVVDEHAVHQHNGRGEPYRLCYLAGRCEPARSAV